MSGDYRQTAGPARPLRVLLVSDFYPPVIGGMERYVQTLARELVRRGHHVVVATQRHPAAPAFEIDQGVRVHRLVGWNRALAPFYDSPERPFHPTVPDPGMMAGLRRVLAAERPDIVNAQGWMLNSCLPLKAWSTAKLIVTLHDYGLVCATKTYMYRNRVCTGPGYATCVGCARAQYGAAKALALTTGLSLSSRMHGRVDRFIAVSAAVRDASLPGLQGRPIEVLPAFIPDTAVAEAAQPCPAFLPPEGSYILFVGAFSAHKGVTVLLEAYRGLEADAPLVMIGSHFGEPFVAPDGVHVACNVPHATVMAAWTRSAFGVVPSIWGDPCPLTAIEAMAAGRALVASAIGGLRDMVVPGETGLLVAPDDVGALRDALRHLIQHPEERARMGRAARERARLFMASTVVERFEEICYAELLGAGQAPGAAPMRDHRVA